MTKFLKDGYYDRFLKRVRSINRQKHDAMIKAINIHLGKDFKIITRGGGLAILIEAKSKKQNRLSKGTRRSPKERYKNLPYKTH